MSQFYRIFRAGSEAWPTPERRKRQFDALLRAASLAAYWREPYIVEAPSGTRQLVTQYGTAKDVQP